MLYGPDFEGRGVSNQGAEPVSWQVKSTPQYKQTRFMVTKTTLSDSKCTVDDHKFGRKILQDTADFLTDNHMDNTDTYWKYLPKRPPLQYLL